VGVVGAVPVCSTVTRDLAADRRRGPIQLPRDLGVPESVRQPGRDLEPVLMTQPASGHRGSSPCIHHQLIATERQPWLRSVSISLHRLPQTSHIISVNNADQLSQISERNVAFRQF
jgi:hypothetical protein